MKKRNTAGTRQIQASENESNPKRWRVYLLTLLCSFLIGAGFFFAGRQHFSSMDFSMRNSRLRKQIDDLQAEKRRLLLAREVAQSPIEIKKAAKKAGLNDAVVFAAELTKAIPETKAKAIGTSIAPPKASGVVKTAEVTPVNASLTSTIIRPERIAKQVKREIKSE